MAVGIQGEDTGDTSDLHLLSQGGDTDSAAWIGALPEFREYRHGNGSAWTGLAAQRCCHLCGDFFGVKTAKETSHNHKNGMQAAPGTQTSSKKEEFPLSTRAGAFRHPTGGGEKV